MKQFSIPPEKKKYAAALVFMLLAFAAVGLVSKYTLFFDSLENKGYDLMMRTVRGPGPRPTDIAVVAVDQASEAEFNARFPWPRSVHGVLIRKLSEAGARLIVFDVIFDLPTTAEEDQALAAAVRGSRVPVVLAASIEVSKDPRFNMVQHLVPLDVLQQAGARYGYATYNPDHDQVIRRAKLSLQDEPTLETQSLSLLGMAVNPSKVPIVSSRDGDPEFRVNYVGGIGTIPTVSFYQAIDYQTLLPKGVFANKVVFVGRSLQVQDISEGKKEKDYYATPFEEMPGVEIHANTLNTFLRGNYISQSTPAETWLILIVPAILVSAIVLGSYSLRAKILFVLGLVVWWQVMASLLFIYWRHWVYTVQPLLVTLTVFGLNTLYQYWATEKERAHIRRALKGYVSSQVMNEILKNPEKLELGGIQVDATVLFSDIAGFSKISEKITPKELAAMLNDYFTRMGDEIMKRDGMINKYIGDAVMAIWGAPLPNPNHAALACESALAMKRVVDGMAPLKARIGVNTGPMVAGNLGHVERMEYTVIGDAVNLASRLEGANKSYGTAILISESTEEVVRGKFLLREVDCIRVLGKEQPVRIYEVVAQDGSPEAEKLRNMLESFSKIIDCYWQRDWDRSCMLIKKHLERFPNDLVAQTYLNRCRHFVMAPPASDWDGVFALETK